jgi:hypothetical protein
LRLPEHNPAARRAIGWLRCNAKPEHGLAFAKKAGFGHAIDQMTAQLGLIRTLCGSTSKFGSFDDGQFDELWFERHLCSNPSLALPECWYWIRKLQARFFAGDYAGALEASSRAQRLLWTSWSLFETAEYHFYGALSQAASWSSALPDQSQQHFDALADHHRQLQIWAENCPENFENRAALVSAEIARIEGRDARRRAPLRTSHPLGSCKRLCPKRSARQRNRRAILCGTRFR